MPLKNFILLFFFVCILEHVVGVRPYCFLALATTETHWLALKEA